MMFDETRIDPVRSERSRRSTPVRLHPLRAMGSLILAASLAFAQIAVAQEPVATSDVGSKAAKSKFPSVEIVELSYAEPEKVARVVNVFGAVVQAHPELGLLTIRGPAERVQLAAAAARNLDAPPQRGRNLDIRVHILTPAAEGQSLPADLQPVADQLSQLFDYGGLRLANTLALRVLEGRQAGLEGSLQLGDGLERAAYGFHLRRARVFEGEGGDSVRLEGMRFVVNATEQADDAKGKDRRRAELATDIEVRLGQKAVLGRAAAEGMGGALILLLEVDEAEM